MTNDHHVHGLTVLAAALERLRSLTTSESIRIGLHGDAIVLPPRDVAGAVHWTGRALFAYAHDGSAWALSLAVSPDGPEAKGATGELIALRLEPREYAQPSVYELGRVIFRRLESLRDKPSIRCRVSVDGRIALLTNDPIQATIVGFIGTNVEKNMVTSNAEDGGTAYRYSHPDTANMLAGALGKMLGL